MSSAHVILIFQHNRSSVPLYSGEEKLIVIKKTTTTTTTIAIKQASHYVISMTLGSDVLHTLEDCPHPKRIFKEDL